MQERRAYSGVGRDELLGGLCQEYGVVSPRPGGGKHQSQLLTVESGVYHLSAVGEDVGDATGEGGVNEELAVCAQVCPREQVRVYKESAVVFLIYTRHVLDLPVDQCALDEAVAKVDGLVVRRRFSTCISSRVSGDMAVGDEHAVVVWRTGGELERDIGGPGADDV